MGQKVNPHGLRVGVIKDWDSRWFAKDEAFGDILVEDYKLRKFLKKTLYGAGVPRIEIERAAAKVRIHIHCAKPGMVIGRGGAEIEKLRKQCEAMINKGKSEPVQVSINIVEVKQPDKNAQLVAENIAAQLERRISFRRAMKQAIGRTMKAGAKGIKVLASGRLGGAEIARSEKYSEGNVPLHTLRADIDYGFAEADTTYGKLGIKVWINHGEILDKGLKPAAPEEKKEGRGRGGKRRDGEKRPRRDGERRPRRDDRRGERAEAPKAVNPRKRNTPKEEPKPVEPETVEPQVEEAQVEAAEAAAPAEE